MLIRTETGSTYEIDQQNKKIRRLHNLRGRQPTEHQGTDGEWKPYEEIVNLKVGSSLVVVWSYIPNEWANVPALQTSPVVEILEDQNSANVAAALN